MYIFRFCWTSTASFACPRGKPHIYPQYILSKLNLRFYPGGSRQTRIQILILNVGVKPDKKKKRNTPTGCTCGPVSAGYISVSRVWSHFSGKLPNCKYYAIIMSDESGRFKRPSPTCKIMPTPIWAA